MFLESLMRRNRPFIDAVVELHVSGDIPSNTYALDLDTVTRNSRLLQERGSSLGLTVFAMTKQMGRNPDFCDAIHGGGIAAAVAVDLECAWYSHEGGLRIGHLGHLVQVPRALVADAMALAPEFWTVMSMEQASLISTAAVARHRVQQVFLRVVAPGDHFYRGHEGGFALDDVVTVAAALDAMPGLQVAGTTSFPALLFNAQTQSLELTPNASTIEHGAVLLERRFDRPMQRNMPGTTSVESMAMMVEAGATQVEPGHGITGTTPLHAVSEPLEIPAALYVSEISHHWHHEAFVIGGGTYRDPVLGEMPCHAIVFAPDGSELGTYEVEMPDPAAIDYTCIIAKPEGRPLPPVGSTVIFGFRIQAFVTRAQTVGVRGVHEGSPKAGLPYAALGSASFITDLQKMGVR